MKRLMAFCLAFLLLAPALFADHANVMPARVGRVFVAPTFIMFDQQFDDDGNRRNAPSTSMFNLGFAAEYGINSWITGAVQWAPGVNVWSDVSDDVIVANPLGAIPNQPATLHSSSGGRVTGAGDVMLGAKIQVVGREAPMQSELFRLAFAPGLMIPVPGPNFSDEIGNSNPRVASLDNHVFGVGLRSFFDWVPNRFFYLNFYNEIRFFPQRGRFRELGFQQAAQAEALRHTTHTLTGGQAPIDVSGLEVNFRYDLTFEIEPTFTYRIEAPIIAFEVGLPFTYFFTPGYTISGVPNLYHLDLINPALRPALTPQDQGNVHLFTIGPNVSMFFMEWPVPMEFRLSYTIPIWGQNTQVRHVFGLQVRTYFRI